MAKKKTLQDVVSSVLSDEVINRAVMADKEKAEPPTFALRQIVNWQGRAAKVNQVFSNGTVEIEITEFRTVKATDIR